MDRSAVVTFSGQLREARENALRDSEAFAGIVHVVERLGSFLNRKILDLGKYKARIGIRASQSALAEAIPDQWPDVHIPFSLLYDLVRNARNDALHQGAFARRLTGHAIELSLVLEDALRRSLDRPVVSDYMVRNPTCAELWQPISFISRLLKNYSQSTAAYGTRKHARSGRSAEPDVQLLVAGSTGAKGPSAARDPGHGGRGACTVVGAV